MKVIYDSSILLFSVTELFKALLRNVGNALVISDLRHTKNPKWNCLKQ